MILFNNEKCIGNLISFFRYPNFELFPFRGMRGGEQHIMKLKEEEGTK